MSQDKYIIAPDRLLSDDQVGILTASMLGNNPNIDVYDSVKLESLNNPAIPRTADAKKVILLQGAITNHNVGETIAEAQRQLGIIYEQKLGTANNINPTEYSFIVPINLGAPATFAAHPSINHQRGNHWVLATFEPDNDRIRNGEGAIPDNIPYKMTFADSIHNSYNNTNKSLVGNRIFQVAGAGFTNQIGNKIPGLNLGATFTDASSGQQKANWECGYYTAENSVDLMSGKPLRQHLNTDIFIENAGNILAEAGKLEASKPPATKQPTNLTPPIAPNRNSNITTNPQTKASATKAATAPKPNAVSSTPANAASSSPAAAQQLTHYELKNKKLAKLPFKLLNTSLGWLEKFNKDFQGGSTLVIAICNLIFGLPSLLLGITSNLKEALTPELVKEPVKTPTNAPASKADGANQASQDSIEKPAPTNTALAIKPKETNINTANSQATKKPFEKILQNGPRNNQSFVSARAASLATQANVRH